MGLFGFGKKKESTPIVQSTDNQQLNMDLLSTDLPSIDGSNVNTFDALPQSNIENNQENNPNSAPQSISINVPTLDFSLPISDDARPQAPQTEQPQSDASQLPYIDVEDLNHLFINDDSWKEPDLDNFEPYAEEKIEEPKPTDFNLKGEDLPRFDDTPIDAPAEPFHEIMHISSKPVELFIRGRAYDRVFVELDQMNKSLSHIDSQSGNYEELLKQEEPLMLSAKEQMEYLYRKLNGLDKKIFAQ